MSDRLHRLETAAAVGQQQSGVVARWQLYDLGWTEGQVDHELRYGRWHVPARGLLAMQNAPLTHDQRLWQGCLHAGPTSALSHLTAARVGGLRWKGEDTIDVITAKGHLVDPLPGFFFHQTRRPYGAWVRRPAGSPPRLQLEHAVLLTAERDRHVRRAIGLIAAAVQQRLTSAADLSRTARQIRKLRHGKIFLAALGDIAGGAQSFAEIDLGRLCEQAGLPAPTRQAVRVDQSGRRRYLDGEWVLADGRVVVLEVDGSFHLEVDHWWRDMKRERQVVISRSVVLRCSSVELRLDPDSIVSDLIKAGVPRRAGFVWVS